MVSVKALISAGAAAVVSTAACAADLGPPPYQYQAPAVFEQGGWYLRGDVGVGVQYFSNFNYNWLNPNMGGAWPASWTIVQKDIQDAAIFGLGVGYEFNNWLRFDVTGEYRTKAGFKATDSYREFCPNNGTCFDLISGNYSAAVVMANAYIDLGTWWCITPYIGAGVGGAYNRITDVQDNGIIADGSNGFGYTYADAANWSLAWNAQAGLTYNVNNNLKIDFSWRYLSLGSPQTAPVQCQDATTCYLASYTLKDMTSQDFRVGLRWMLQPEAPVIPLSTRG